MPGHFASVKVRRDVVLTLSCKISSLVEFDREKDEVTVVKGVFRRAGDPILAASIPPVSMPVLQVAFQPPLEPEPQ